MFFTVQSILGDQDSRLKDLIQWIYFKNDKKTDQILTEIILLLLIIVYIDEQKRFHASRHLPVLNIHYEFLGFSQKIVVLSSPRLPPANQSNKAGQSADHTQSYISLKLQSQILSDPPFPRFCQNHQTVKPLTVSREPFP